MMENAENQIHKLISTEPSYRWVFYKTLRFCETPRSTVEVEKEVLSFPEMKTAIHSPNIILNWLEEAGGIEKVVLEEEERWKTTEVGKEGMEEESPQKKLLELISKEPLYSEIYMQVLRFCLTPRKRSEIEELLKGNLVMERAKVYPTFFINGLEGTGGLEWVDNCWRTTEAGKGVAA